MCAHHTHTGVVASDYLTHVCGSRPLHHGENLAEWMMDFLTMVRVRVRVCDGLPDHGACACACACV